MHEVAAAVAAARVARGTAVARARAAAEWAQGTAEPSSLRAPRPFLRHFRHFVRCFRHPTSGDKNRKKNYARTSVLELKKNVKDFKCERVQDFNRM